MKNRIQQSEQIQNKVQNLKQNELLFYFCKNNKYMLVAWKDKKPLFFITSYGDSKVSQAKRNTQNNDHLFKLPQYSQTARRVDLLDQMNSYNETDLKSKKWYYRIIHHLLQNSLYNLSYATNDLNIYY
ncbi:hypothetical protein ABPG72_016398 [Tetrahymena utriculariae]